MNDFTDPNIGLVETQGDTNPPNDGIIYLQPDPTLKVTDKTITHRLLKANGGYYSKSNDWDVHVKVDGLLVTGQNPASSAATADGVLKLLQ